VARKRKKRTPARDLSAAGNATPAGPPPPPWKQASAGAAAVAAPIFAQLLGGWAEFALAAGVLLFVSFWFPREAWRHHRRRSLAGDWRCYVPLGVALALGVLGWGISERNEREARFVAEQALQREELERRLEAMAQSAAGVSSYQTCRSNGASTPASLVVSVSGYSATSRAEGLFNYVGLTQEDPEGCELSVGETGAREGQELQIVNRSPNPATMRGYRSVVELAGPLHLEEGDAITLRYAAQRWIEVTRVAAR
jgi:hypothetical protein